MTLATRLDLFQESVIREMTRKAIEHNAINLSQGMPDYSPPRQLQEGIIGALKANEHQYTITHGRRDLRQAIAKKLSTYNKIEFNPEHEITVTCGASEAIASSILALLDPNDEIIIFEPIYENYVPSTILAHGKVIPCPLSEKDFRLDEEQLKNCITNKTKAIIVNTPHNPTGINFQIKELRFIADLCVENNIIAITDEIYEHIIYDNHKHTSLASLDGMFERTITISGISKSFSATGWRVGYVAATKELSAGIRKCHDYITVCAPSLQQKAALRTFELKEDYFKDLKNTYQANRDFLYKQLQNLDFKPFKPSGAYYMFTDITEFDMSDLEMADFLVKDEGVATVPGSSFYYGKTKEKIGKNYIRFSFSQKRSTLEEAMERVKNRMMKL